MNKNRRDALKLESLQGGLVSVVFWAAVVALLAPLYKGIGVVNYSAFNHGTIFQIAAEVAIAAWLVLAITDRRFRPDWRQPVVIAATAFMAWTLLSLIWSVEPRLAFWGGRRRMMGIVQYAHYYFFFLALASTWRQSWPEWRRLFFWGNLACLGVGLLALKEWIAGGGTQRVLSVIGNPIHLGIYAALYVFIALMLFFTAPTGRRRWLYAALAVFYAGVAVVLCATRSATLALAVAAVVLALLLFGEGRSRRFKTGLFAGTTLVVLLLVGAFFCLRSPVGKTWGTAHLPFFAQRMIYSSLGSERLALWRIGWEGIREKPLFGYGLESYEPLFGRLFDPAGRDNMVVDFRGDRAHNQFLEAMLSLGGIGLALYLALYAAIFWQLVRRLRVEPDRARRRLLMAGIAFFIAYAVAMVFFLEAPTHTLLFWLLAAVTVGLTGGTPLETDRPRPNAAKVGRVLIFVFLPPFLLIIFWLNFLPQALSYMNTAGCIKSVADPAGADRLLRRSLGTWTYVTEDLRYRAANCLEGARNAVPVYWRRLGPTAAFVAGEMEKSAAARPDNYYVLLAAAEAERLAADFEPARLAAAERHARRAVELAPRRAEAGEELGQVLLTKSGPEAALAVYEAALPFAQVYNNGVGRLRYLMTVAEVGRGNLDGAFARLDDTLATGYPVEDHVNLLADLVKLLPGGPTDQRFVSLLERFESKYPSDHPDLMRAQAIAAHQTGDEALARELVGKIAKIDQTTADLTRQDLGWSVMEP